MNNCEAIIFSFIVTLKKWNPSQYGWLEIEDDHLVKSTSKTRMI